MLWRRLSKYAQKIDPLCLTVRAWPLNATTASAMLSIIGIGLENVVGGRHADLPVRSQPSTASSNGSYSCSSTP